MPVNLRVIDNKKYMWDGKEYENEGDALNVAAAYKKDNFDVQLIQEEGKYLIYTRRVAATTPSTN
jgi:hypothetical protein